MHLISVNKNRGKQEKENSKRRKEMFGTFWCTCLCWIKVLEPFAYIRRTYAAPKKSQLIVNYWQCKQGIVNNLLLPSTPIPIPSSRSNFRTRNNRAWQRSCFKSWPDVSNDFKRLMMAMIMMVLADSVGVGRDNNDLRWKLTNKQMVETSS